MPTNKNLFRQRGLLCLALVAALASAGCGPPGPRALLEGKHLIDRGNYAAAVEKLNTATELMATNAQAWNYLGLACHLAGQPDAAATAYQKALRLDHDLVVAHFNLGCLWLDQNQPDKLEGARNELTAFTLHQGNSPLGWVKLGTVELRQRDTAAAEKCFWQALQLGSNNPEALNGLGLVELQYNRHRDAVACFENAIAQQPNYAPALLNLAITAQGYPAERPLALQKYRQYLALTPKPANWDEVNAVAGELEREVVLAARPASDVPANPPRTGPSNYTRPAPGATVARNETTAASTSTQGSDSDTAPSSPPEVVQIQSQPIMHVAASSNTPASRTTNAAARTSSGDDTVVISPPVDDAAPDDAARPGFFQRMNPFHRGPTPVQTPGPVAENNPSGTTAGNAPASPPAPRVPRYSYVSPAKPAEGNRAQAERYFAQAMEAQRDHQSQDAERLYRAATQADPPFSRRNPIWDCRPTMPGT